MANAAEHTTLDGSKTYGDRTLNELLKHAEAVMGDWDGDDAGAYEDRARIAADLVNDLNKLLDTLIELEGEAQ